MKLADAFGVLGMRAADPLDVGRLVRQAVDKDRPVLIEVPVGRMPKPIFFGSRKNPTKYQQPRSVSG
jgi:thiamine pyrophosphate-dependent acetolactate synthase large subunit-like protein